MYKYHLKVLLSGFKVVLIPIEKSNLVRVYYSVGVGFNHQGTHFELPHFLEHLQSKYTSTKHPDAIKNKFNLDQKGFYGNAETTNSYTAYWLEGQAQYLEFLLDIFLNSITDFQIDNEIVEKERNAVRTELLSYSQNLDKLDVAIQKFMFSKSDLKNATIQNRLASVSKISVQDVLDFRQKYYSGRNSLIAVCGDFDVKKIYKYIKHHFKPYNHLDYEVSSSALVSVPINTPHIMFYNTENDLSRIVVRYFNEMDDFTRDSPIITAVHYLLSGGTLSSRLIKKLRVDDATIYGIQSVHESYMNGINCDSFETYCESKNVMKVISVIISEVENLKSEPITDDELTKIKNLIMNRLYSERLDKTLSNTSDLITKHILWDKPLFDYDFYLRKIKQLDQTVIIKIANRMFDSNKLLISYSSSTDYTNQIKKLFDKKEIKFLKV